MENDFKPPWERGEAKNEGGKTSNLNLARFNPLIRKSGYALFIVPMAVMIFAGAFIYYKNRTSVLGTETAPPNTSQINEAEVKGILEKVGKLTVLPKETPTIATVADVKSLQKQPFFEKAQNGDKVLIFERARRAILYRPSTNKIIEIGPVIIPTQTATPSAAISPSITPEATVAPVQTSTLTPAQ
jgi:hypothetical protein